MDKRYQKYFTQKRYEFILTFIGSFLIGLLAATVFGVNEYYVHNMFISWAIGFIGWTGNTWIFRKIAAYYPNYRQNTKRIL